MNDYLTIKEYAEVKGITPQAVYKRLSTSLKDFYVIVNGKKMLKKSVLEEESVNHVVNQSDNNKPTFSTKVDNDIIRINERNEKIIDELRAEIRDKDNQIKEQSQKIIELSNRITQLFENDQKLFLNNQYLLKYEKENKDDSKDENINIVEQKKDEHKNQSKGFFRKLFNKN